MAYVIADPCIGEKSKRCVAVCPVACIYDGPAQSFIHPTECIDCDLCRTACPVDAIFRVDQVPARFAGATARNARFFGLPERRA